MRAFIQVFWLEFVGFVRSRALAMLGVAALAWMFAAPYVFCHDGTDEGAREMCVRFALGGVTTLLAVALLVTAAGSLSRERSARRLQLTMVRPVRLWSLALAKIVALSLAGALVLALATVVEGVRQDGGRVCSSVYRPVLPSPAEEAASMYDVFMADPDTPPAAKKASKSAVMRLLTQRAIDHYQTVPTNAAATWTFPVSLKQPLPASHLRFRFSNAYNMRDDVRGEILGEEVHAVVSNISQAIIRIPLERRLVARDASAPQGDAYALSFTNQGARAVMLRPRRDVELMIGADGFRPNLLRAYLQLVGMLTLLVSFGVLLGACLSRPVAVFVAVVALALSEMSPSVLEQYPMELETSRADAVGLAIARATAYVTHPVGSLRPLAALAADERVEPREVVRTLVVDAVVVPLLFALLAAFVLPRKQEDL